MLRGYSTLHPLITTKKLANRAAREIRAALGPILNNIPIVLNTRISGIYTQTNYLNVYIIDSALSSFSNSLLIEDGKVSFNVIGSDIVISNKLAVVVDAEDCTSRLVPIDNNKKLDIMVKLLSKIIESNPNFCSCLIPEKQSVESMKDVTLTTDIDKEDYRSSPTYRTITNFYENSLEIFKEIRIHLDYLIDNKIIKGALKTGITEYLIVVKNNRIFKLCTEGNSKVIKVYYKEDDTSTYLDVNDIVEFFTKFDEKLQNVV